MKNLPEKLKLLFLPFILISSSFLIIYTFLHWLITIKLGLLQGVNEEILDYWVPFILPWIIIPLFMWKNINKLRFSDTYRRSTALYIFVAAMAMAIPTVIAVIYMRTATGKLTRIASSDQFDKAGMTKFYQIDSMYLDKHFYGSYWYYKTSGKYNEDRTFYEFIAIPVMSSPSDTLEKEFGLWYGLSYEEEIDNDLEESVKDSLFVSFRKRNMQSFSKANLYDVSYFDRIGTSPGLKGLTEAIKYTDLAGKSQPVILIPKYDLFESRSGHKLLWVFISFWLGSVAWLLMLLMKPFKDSEILKMNQLKKDKVLNPAQSSY